MEGSMSPCNLGTRKVRVNQSGLRGAAGDLREHLIDMRNVALHVKVTERAALDTGSELAVRPTTDAARASLEKVLDAHPMMLRHEAG